VAVLSLFPPTFCLRAPGSQGPIDLHGTTVLFTDMFDLQSSTTASKSSARAVTNSPAPYSSISAA
jgi:hypothetical protein